MSLSLANRRRFAVALSCASLVILGNAVPALAQVQVGPGFPLQLEAAVPYPPTPFPNGGRTHLVYEIYLRSFSFVPLTLDRIEVLDADAAVAPLAAFEGEVLDRLLIRLGPPLGSREPPQPLPAGGTMIVYLSVALPEGASPPTALRHRIVAGDQLLEGAEIAVATGDLRVFGPPVQGSGWRLYGGPDNFSGHRRGVVIFDGRPEISRRFATDWVQVENGETFTGDREDNLSYLAYGEEVLAVTDATVVSVRDGQADNIPGQWQEAAPLDTISGNYVTLDLGNGLFARYLHLQPASIRVKAGDRVQRGQVLALIGNSGDSRQPHLHFDVSTAMDVLAGEGQPFLIDEYWLSYDGGAPERRTNEVLIPHRSSTVSFLNPGASE